MKGSTKFILIFVVIVITIGLLGIFLYKKSNRNNKETQEQTLPAIKVMLLNGCGFEGAAREFSDFLTHMNIDIVAMSNTRKPIYDKTIIVVRKGTREDLQRLQRLTGIARFTEARNETVTADFDIIIGKDYEQYIKRNKDGRL